MQDNNQIPTTLNWKDSRLDLQEEYLRPPIILKIDDSVIFTLGNFSASAGKEKSKKTFNTVAITACLLANEPVLNYTPIKVDDRNQVLYVDTEQSNYHCRKVASRILKLANIPIEDSNDRLIFLALRKFSPEQRIEIIEKAIYDNEGVFLVIIDGLRDLVLDINNPNEATQIMTKLLKWTDECNIHIHSVLHLNKTDENTRGHLGTELNNKSETILQVTKSTIESNVSIVSCKTIRDISFDDFAFCISSDGLPELFENYSNSTITKSFDYNELSEDEHKDALYKVFEQKPTIGYGLLIKNLQLFYKEVTGLDFGISKTKSLKVFLQNKRMILQEGKKYYLNKEFYF